MDLKGKFVKDMCFSQKTMPFAFTLFHIKHRQHFSWFTQSVFWDKRPLDYSWERKGVNCKTKLFENYSFSGNNLHGRSGKINFKTVDQRYFLSIFVKNILRSTHIFMILFLHSHLFSETLALTFSSHHSNKDTKTTSTLRAEYMR